jgi:predicted permease
LIKNKELKRCMTIGVAVVITFVHFVLAGFLSFYGTVIDPSTLQKFMSLVAVVMTLPFCILNFIDFGSSSINNVTSIAGTVLGLFFWVWAYLKMIRKVMKVEKPTNLMG